MHCTTEVFLWPSIVYQPLSLAKALTRGGVWLQPAPSPAVLPGGDARTDTPSRTDAGAQVKR